MAVVALHVTPEVIVADAKGAVPEVLIMLHIISRLFKFPPIGNATEWVPLILHVEKVCIQSSNLPGNPGVCLPPA